MTLQPKNEKNRNPELIDCRILAPIIPCWNIIQRAFEKRVLNSMKSITIPKTVVKSYVQRDRYIKLQPRTWCTKLCFAIVVWTPLKVSRNINLHKRNLHDVVNEEVASCQTECPNLGVVHCVSADIIVVKCLAVAAEDQLEKKTILTKCTKCSRLRQLQRQVRGTNQQCRISIRFGQLDFYCGRQD